jgi:drug/metabolite transporter (DMT)-like permease
MTCQPGTRDRLRAIVYLVVSVSLFGVVDGMSKILTPSQSFGQIVLGRYALALPLLLAVAGPSGWKALFATRRPGLQLFRGLTPLIVGGVMVIAVHHLPLAEATVILFAGPFIVVALSAPLLGEKVGATSYVAVAVGFLAVVLVARPGFGQLSWYTVFPLVGAIFYALLQLLTRKLADAGEDADTTLAWTLAIGLVASAPLAAVSWAPVSPGAFLLLILLGAVFGAAQLLLARAFLYAPANILTPFSYAQIVAATLFGLVVFEDVPDLWTVLGIVMIIGAGVYVMRRAT